MLWGWLVSAFRCAYLFAGAVVNSVDFSLYLYCYAFYCLLLVLLLWCLFVFVWLVGSLLIVFAVFSVWC